MKGAFTMELSMGVRETSKSFSPRCILVDTYLGEKFRVLCLPNSTNLFAFVDKALHIYINGPKIENENSQRIGTHARKLDLHANSRPLPEHVDTYKRLKEKENALKKNEKVRCENTHDADSNLLLQKA